MPGNKIFLDTNKVIDLFETRNKKLTPEMLLGSQVYISPLSIHILCYVARYKIPSNKLKGIGHYFHFIDLSPDILTKALEGPTSDLEDNIQLHSAIGGDCDLFLTDDRKVLKMKFFGKVKISSSLR